MTRMRPDRFDGDAHPGADADICPLCGYAAPPGEMSTGNPRTCSSCGGEFAPPSKPGPWLPDRREGAATWS